MFVIYSVSGTEWWKQCAGKKKRGERSVSMSCITPNLRIYILEYKIFHNISGPHTDNFFHIFLRPKIYNDKSQYYDILYMDS